MSFNKGCFIVFGLVFFNDEVFKGMLICYRFGSRKIGEEIFSKIWVFSEYNRDEVSKYEDRGGI